MPAKTTEQPAADLRSLLRTALEAYEQALVTRRRQEAQASAALEQMAALHQRQQAELAEQHTAERLRELGQLQAEVQRLGHLLTVTAQLETAAQALLGAAGLAHIAGAPIAVDGDPAAARRDDAAVAAAFVSAQTAYVHLRATLYDLAQAQAAAGQWEAARKTVQGLLEDGKGPLHAEAAAFERECYLTPARQALAAGQPAVAQAQLEAWLGKHKDDTEAAALLRSSYLDPAQQALDAKDWVATREYLGPWLQSHKGDVEAQELWRASYLQPARQALALGKWADTRTHLHTWLQAHQEDAEAMELRQESYQRPAETALDNREWLAAREIVEQWIKECGNSANIASLEQLTYRLPLLQALQLGQLDEACAWANQAFERYAGAHDTLGLSEEVHARLAEVAVQRKDWPLAMYAVTQALKHVRREKYVALRQKTLENWLDCVKVGSAQISRTPVTNGQYKVFVNSTGYRLPSYWANRRIPTGKEDHPVVSVSWYDAQAFCRWAGAHLPSTQEWQQAAVNGNFHYPWGDSAPDSTRCNYAGHVGATTPVGAYPRGVSPAGLVDMVGNVREWTNSEPYAPSLQDPIILRGGGFQSQVPELDCRNSKDFMQKTDAKYDIGFRIAVGEAA